MSWTHTPVLTPLVTTGSVLRHEALAAGMSVEDVMHLVKIGVWRRIRRGAYAEREAFEALTPEQRHLVVAGAVVRMLDAPAVLGHVTAAIAHELPAWGADLREVHVLRPSPRHGSRREAGVWHHSALLPADHLVQVGGLDVTSPARSLIDHARTVPFEAAVCTLDAALHAEVVRRDELRAVLEWQQDWPGSRQAGSAVAFMDGRSESVGETRGRVRIHEAGLPTPELQPDIFDANGFFVGRVDFLMLEHGTIGEFDGRITYRAKDEDCDGLDALVQEKAREDRLRALGFQVVRFTWDDLGRGPLWIRRMFLEAFARAELSPPPTGIVRLKERV
jgi:hypothetical protein